MTRRGRCVTALCRNDATRTVRWENSAGDPMSGRFCDECARRLWERGDDVDPPFPLADVIPLRPPS